MKLRPMTAIYLTRGDKILLLYRIGSRVVGNSYTGAAGGHMEAGEYRDPRACVMRELLEETGITGASLDGLALRYITMRNKNGEIRQNYYFFARLKEERPLTSTEGTLRRVPYGQIPALEMPVSAKHMILHYVKEGRFTDKLYAGITEERGTHFVEMREF